MPKPVFAPENPEQLLLGWLLHARKERERHDEAARVLERRRGILGVLTAIASALGGGAVVTPLVELLDGSDSGASWSLLLLGALATAVAAVLNGVVAFLDYGGRVARHRGTATLYKATLRDLERAHAFRGTALDEGNLKELDNRLDSVETEAPVVPPGVGNKVEATFKDAAFVSKADQMFPKPD